MKTQHTKGRRMMDKLTDFELNKGIAELIFPDSDVCDRDDMMPNDENPDAVQVIHEVGISGEYVDYLNDWNDLMPLVVEYVDPVSIGRSFVKKPWKDEPYDPQRALAECALKVLKVLQEKQGDE